MFTANTKKFLCIESFIRFYFQIAAMLFEYEQILFMHALQEHYYCAVLYIYATDIYNTIFVQICKAHYILLCRNYYSMKKF